MSADVQLGGDCENEKDTRHKAQAMKDSFRIVRIYSANINDVMEVPSPFI
jgi:hypothetical protein